MPEPAVLKPTTPLERTIVFLAMGFGVGRIRHAPGTWGSLLGVGIAWALHLFDATSPIIYWSVTMGTIAVGIPLCEEAGRILGQKDPQRVVWDEIAAVLVVFLVTPVTWGTAVAGFLLFRLFDIWKPWPIERFERLPGGLGIMADDLAAAVISLTILAPLARAWP